MGRVYVWISLSRSKTQNGPHIERSMRTHTHMHSQMCTCIPKPQKVKLLWVSACFHDTVNPEFALNLTINQQITHRTRLQASGYTHTCTHTQMNVFALSVQVLCNISVQYGYLSVIWRCSRKLSSTSSE